MCVFISSWCCTGDAAEGLAALMSKRVNYFFGEICPLETQKMAAFFLSESVNMPKDFQVPTLHKPLFIVRHPVTAKESHVAQRLIYIVCITSGSHVIKHVSGTLVVSTCDPVYPPYTLIRQ